MLRQFICNRFPQLKIRNAGKRAEFVDGYFETEDPVTQKLVERNDLYGVHIWERDAVEAEAVAEAKAAVPGPGEGQTFGGIQTGGNGDPSTIKVQGKAKAEELKALYGEPVNVAGNWYTFDTSKKGEAND